jgi:CDP-4-dehydro-6-deoxyglucose reductase
VAEQQRARAERARELKPAVATLQPSGRVLEVQAGESVLAGALRAGIHLPHSCRRGSCQSCRARIVVGSVHYPEGRPSGLSASEEAAGYALLCQAHASTPGLVVDVEELALGDDVRIHRVPSRVERFERLAHDVMALYLKLPPVIRFRFVAGQYLDVVREGRRHSFSIASPPHDATPIELHVRHVPGGELTDWVFEGLEAGALLRIEGPLGGFYLREESTRPILMMAGGTGFAPIKSMLRHLHEAGPARPVHFYWGVRAARDLYADALLTRWMSEHDGFRYTPVLSEPTSADAWRGRTGWVHEALVHDYPDLSGFELYMAGPPQMIEAAKVAFARHGLPREHLHFDSFEYTEPR